MTTVPPPPSDGSWTLPPDDLPNERSPYARPAPTQNRPFHGQPPHEQPTQSQPPDEWSGHSRAPYGQPPDAWARHGQAPHGQPPDAWAGHGQAPYGQPPHEQAGFGGPPVELPPLPYRPGGRPRKARRRLVLGVVVLAVAAGGAGAGALLVSSDGKPARRAAPPARVPAAWLPAARQAAALDAVRFDATLTRGGEPVRIRLGVTRRGSATGTITAAGTTADLVSVAGATYLKAGESFWRAQPGAARPDDYAGRWTKAPASVFGVDVRNVLAPRALAAALAGNPRVTSATAPGGVPAYQVRTRRADYLIARTAPFGLLAVRAAGHGDPLFAATPRDDAPAVRQEVRTRVAALGGAVDPALRFATGTLSFLDCDQNVNGCTVSVPAQLSAPGTVPPDARALLRATVTADGAALGSCAASAPVPRDRSLVLRCTVTSPGWRTWMRRAMDTPGRHPYAANARVLGLAVAPGDVARLLTAVDAER
ncbi:hypothetical protein [Actinomadura rayongensis]|uniref:Uncharacterized protein n=1 Tax=Actinomadura rayongensis TaxID=1429076 RepID=A0A6I4VZ90_9ACTN|nr:hypothetical protein [Actinomadura rayongensis]MXQ62573.1 hypothetical protein [Actinomadura rayongensis]